MASNTRKIVGGLGWSFGERILAQGVSFLISIVLARILAPDQFGVISLILVFINIANVFVANGLKIWYDFSVLWDFAQNRRSISAKTTTKG